jgi:exopolysaccharide production protein ExoZ
MYKSLQAGRAIAAVFVVLFHLGANLAKSNYFNMDVLAIPFSFGACGVEFFFVLSGFIILTAHRTDIGKPERVFAYFRKRLVRIYPTYWLVFLPVFLVALLVPSMRSAVPHDLQTVAQSLLLIPQDKAIVGGTGAPVIIVAWTLQYEILFYLFFGLLVVNPQFAILTGLGFLGCYLFGMIGEAPALPFPFSFIGQDYVILFGMGMLTAWCTSLRLPFLKANFNLLLNVGLLIFFISALDIVFRGRMFADFYTLMFGASASIIVLGLVTAEDNGRAHFSQSWVQVLGDSSYAIYLIHFPLISVLCKIATAAHLQSWGLLGAIFAFVVIFLTCLGVGVLFHLRIERPIAAFFKRAKSADLRSTFPS